MVIELVIDGDIKCAVGDDQAELILVNLVRDVSANSVTIGVTGNVKERTESNRYPFWYRDEVFVGATVSIRLLPSGQVTEPEMTPNILSASEGAPNVQRLQIECSFCGNRTFGTKNIAVGVKGSICSDCVKICADALR